MKNYNFQHLPKTWCVCVPRMRSHERYSDFEDFVTKHSEGDKPRGYYFGISLQDKWQESNSYLLFNDTILTPDDFFALVDDLRLEEGNYLYCCGDGAFFKNGKLYKIHKSIAPRDDETIFIIDDRKAAFYLDRFTNRDNLFRNATSYEIALLKEVQPPEYINYLDWKVGDSMKCVRDYEDIVAGEECKIVDGDSDYIYFEGAFGQEQNISYSVLLKHFEKVVWMPKHKESILAKLHPLNDFSEFEYGICLDGVHYVYDTLFDAKTLHQAVEIKSLEKQIPYLSQIEELIKKSNAESDFSVLTLNIEKK